MENEEIIIKRKKTKMGKPKEILKRIFMDAKKKKYSQFHKL